MEAPAIRTGKRLVPLAGLPVCDPGACLLDCGLTSSRSDELNSGIAEALPDARCIRLDTEVPSVKWR